MNNDLAVFVKDLTKLYPATKFYPANIALDKFDLSIKQGDFFALLGSNGAGKSTLINILASTVIKTEGRISVLGNDIDTALKEVKQIIGVVPQEIVIDSFFTLEQLLEFTAGYYGIRVRDRKTTEILKALGLFSKKDNYPRQLSGGMKRRFLVAKAIVHSPKVLILDEPTAGVDIELREQLWNYVKMLNNNGCTIIITTHYLEEAEHLCNQIAFINKGKIVKQDSKENIMTNLTTKYIEVEFESSLTEDTISILKNMKYRILSPTRIHYNIDNETNFNSILTYLHSLNLVIKNVQTVKLGLADIFKTLMN